MVTQKDFNDLKAKYNKLKKDFDEFRKDTKERDTRADLIQGAGNVVDVADSTAKRVRAIEDSLREISDLGAGFATGGPLQVGLSQTAFELDKLLANPKLGIESFKALTKEIKQFGLIAKSQIGDQGKLNSQLSTQAALLSRLGLSYGDFAKNVDMAIFSFGQSADGVKKINVELKNFATSVNMLPSQISRNFQTIARNLAYDFNTIKQQFTGIQKLSTQTGVAVDTLMGKFGQPMDTIQGASDAAARLNMMLGQNVFSSTELLMMDETTRMQRIRDALMNSNAGKLALSGQGPQSKFALQAIANDVLGMSIDDTRRLLQEGDPESVKKQMQRATGTAFKQGQDELVMSNDKLKTAITDLTEALLNEQFTSTNREILKGRRQALERGPEDRTAFMLQAGGLLSQTLGYIPGQQIEDVTRASMAARELGLDAQFSKAIEFLQMGMIDEAEFSRMVSQLSSGDPSNITLAKSTLQGMAQMSPASIGGKFNEFEQSVLNQLPPGPAKRLMMKKFSKEGADFTKFEGMTRNPETGKLEFGTSIKDAQGLENFAKGKAEAKGQSLKTQLKNLKMKKDVDPGSPAVEVLDESLGVPKSEGEVTFLQPRAGGSLLSRTGNRGRMPETNLVINFGEGNMISKKLNLIGPLAEALGLELI